MTVPMRDRAKVFDAITATETKGLHTVGLGQNQYAGAILLEVVGASSPSWTLDIQGRVHESGTYANIDYVRHFQGGAAALANAQLTVDFTTARYYLVPNPPQFVQLVATRTAGSLTIYASYISLAFAQWLLTTARGAVYVEGPAAENAAVAGQPLLVGGRYDVSDRTLGDGDVGAVGLTVKGFVKAVNPDGTNIGGTGGTSHTDDAAFTPATDDGTVAFAVADETSPDSVDEGDAGAVRMTLNRILKVIPALYDGTTQGADHQEANRPEETILASAARTATTSSADQTNKNHRGVVVTLAVSAVPGTDTVQLKIEYKVTGNTTYQALLIGAAIASAVTQRFVLYPGAVDTGGDLSEATALPLPRQWRITVTHSASSSFTYAVYAQRII